MVSQLDFYTAFICCRSTVSQCTSQTSIDFYLQSKMMEAAWGTCKTEVQLILLIRAQRSLCLPRYDFSQFPHDSYCTCEM
jgi:hypothetical protein